MENYAYVTLFCPWINMNYVQLKVDVHFKRFIFDINWVILINLLSSCSSDSGVDSKADY